MIVLFKIRKYKMKDFKIHLINPNRKKNLLNLNILNQAQNKHKQKRIINLFKQNLNQDYYKELNYQED